MAGNTSRRYPLELKARAVRMVAEVRGDHDSEWAAMWPSPRSLDISARRTAMRFRPQQVLAAEPTMAPRSGVTALAQLHWSSAHQLLIPDVFSPLTRTGHPQEC